MSLTINGVNIAVQGVRALKPGITIEQASQKTKNNGLDEVFFTSNGKAYVAYGDSLNLSGLKKNSIPTVTFEGQKADVIVYEDEANSMLEGAKLGSVKALKDTSDAVFGAVKNIITTIGPTAGIAGGVGIAGYGIYQMLKTTGQGAATGAVGATLAGATAGGLPPGMAGGIWDALKSGVVGGLKLIAVAGAVGAGISMGYGAIKGAMEAKSTVKDISSIASITEDGSSPTNGGPAIANHTLGLPLPGQTVNGQPSYGTNQPGYGINIQINPQGAYGYTPQVNYNPAYAAPPAPMGSVSGMMSPQQLMGMQRH
ncbi:hypothetical protein COW36_01230 [bacterium (Candidatus Blackallbacteria) CG17_big_fil_post_rev_8_21_14_2_50_48_46]|uniref:Uncharacterized protein n=1 Tax=bacterium (Candidatus Blackallbacteria) CG17_big_fil_post_rev_8_21_14_2_50_48_46 TaxID=2014261 RepID=A0A2M7GBC2_9BACT|nr:MAG: hypothetical protein COW64_09945 [bacterium (Candidatus Blackallbacteria) CG18_big_fil_WC_8_21_14_2_50_49_26]PIW19491.1 MAG: hypothetical protein COW36_01230 [bacterium (Candidatus Blackallbacteria) CG17_big_fil_post_rev_8_21_14_2_50_48_46]PIW48905.1 MAG: hypothetical protein COW20_07225 [bacterium (Candidatus Blackallbacteria) CG13_big_fil_rev_8_21_14_2_50_49_14]